MGPHQRAGDGDANKVDADTVFQLASLSKSLAATVVAARRGRRLDPPAPDQTRPAQRSPQRQSRAAEQGLSAIRKATIPEMAHRAGLGGDGAGGKAVSVPGSRRTDPR